MRSSKKRSFKEKEWALNIAFNRWQFNRPRYVGRLSESIRACAPRTLEDWERYPLVIDIIGETLEILQSLSYTHTEA
jgi:hypothetical protein